MTDDATEAQERARQEMIDRIMRPVVLTAPGMSEVNVIRDLPYATDDPLQLLDIYQPAGAPFAPVVMLVHGWADIQYRPKEWGIFQSWARLLAARGFAVLLFNHRLGADGSGAEDRAPEDLQSVLWYARTHGREYRLNPDRLGVMLFSGGGDLLAEAKAQADGAGAGAIAAYYPLLTNVLSRLDLILRRDGAPMLIVRAGQDEMPGLLPALDQFVSEARAAEVRLELIDHPGGVHGFENRPEDPDAPRIIAQTLEFLERALGEPK